MGTQVKLFLKGLVSPETEACIIVLTPIILAVALLAIAGRQ